MFTLFLAAVYIALPAAGFEQSIFVPPQPVRPGVPVTVTLSGLLKNPNLHIDSINVNGSTIVINASAPGAICGPACGYTTQTTFNAPAQPGIYTVEYWLTTFDAPSLVATGRLVVAEMCDFGHSLTVDRPAVYRGQTVTLEWCDPSFTLGDFGYIATRYRVYSSDRPDGPFTPVVDLGYTTTHAAVVPSIIDPTYYYVESHGCMDVLANCGLHSDDVTLSSNIVAVSSVPFGSCLPDDKTLCLDGGRFAVTAQWTVDVQRSGDGHPIPLTDTSGAFWFFSSDNVEVTVKIVGACSFSPPAFWVFASGVTNVHVDLAVTDVRRKVTKHYINPLATPFQPMFDTVSFSCP